MKKYSNGFLSITINTTLILLLISIQLFAQKNASLPRSTPEAEGVSSAGIINFLDAVSESQHEFHSFMMLRHGKVIAEGWWDPYKPGLLHTMYSVSKSFTATAIGFLVSENRISVDDKVISFFPDDLPGSISPYLAELRIKDLLSMSAGHNTDPTYNVCSNYHWVKEFFKTPIVDKPGTKFLYNTVATYMLSAIVQKVTGEKIIDYLKPRLWDPLGISGIDWENDPRGISTGGWGLRLKTEDMAKFGQLFLQKGMWNGKQIIPAAWIDEATSVKILQEPDAPQSKKDSSDWLQGYCYQMWRSRNNSFRADGAFGQFIIVLPEQDVVIVITSEAPDMQSELNLVWEYILPAIKPGKLPADAKALGKLKEKCASLALPLPKPGNSPIESTISGKTFGFISGGRNLESISFKFENNVCQVNLDTDTADYLFNFGAGKWVMDKTVRFGPNLSLRAGGRIGLPPFKVAGNYAWKDKNTLQLKLCYIESPHTETITCRFESGNVYVDFLNIFNEYAQRTIYKGVLTKNLDNPPRLIIRGDDLGYSHSSNEALIKCYTEGIETSIEVMVPAPWFPEGVKMLNQNRQVDVGLHFAITSEWDNIKWRPLTDCPSLKNADGYFYQMISPNKNYPGQSVAENPWTTDDYEKELRAQIEMALKYIPRLSHISGHMLSTMFTPEVKEIVKRVAKEYNLEAIDVDPENDIQTSYIWTDLSNKNIEAKIDAFIKMLDQLEVGKTYVFVEHPGIDNDELRAINHIGYEDVAQGRQDVTTIFTSEKVKQAIHHKGIKLVSYKDVIDGRK